MILVACGLKREARELQRQSLTIVAGGGASADLEAKLEAAASAGISAIISAGIAGAFAPSLKVGAIVIGEQVIGHGEADARIAARLIGLLPGAQLGAVLGSDRIWASATDKQTMFRGTNALAGDMESHIVARVAVRHGLPFAVARVISDSAQDNLPPAALVGMKPDGGMALGAVLASLARRPAQLPALIATGRKAETAFKRVKILGDALGRLATLPS